MGINTICQRPMAIVVRLESVRRNDGLERFLFRYSEETCHPEAYSPKDLLLNA